MYFICSCIEGKPNSKCKCEYRDKEDIKNIPIIEKSKTDNICNIALALARIATVDECLKKDDINICQEVLGYVYKDDIDIEGLKGMKEAISRNAGGVVEEDDAAAAAAGAAAGVVEEADAGGVVEEVDDAAGAPEVDATANSSFWKNCVKISVNALLVSKLYEKVVSEQDKYSEYYTKDTKDIAKTLFSDGVTVENADEKIEIAKSEVYLKKHYRYKENEKLCGEVVQQAFTTVKELIAYNADKTYLDIINKVKLASDSHGEFTKKGGAWDVQVHAVNIEEDDDGRDEDRDTRLGELAESHREYKTSMNETILKLKDVTDDIVKAAEKVANEIAGKLGNDAYDLVSKATDPNDANDAVVSALIRANYANYVRMDSYEISDKKYNDTVTMIALEHPIVKVTDTITIREAARVLRAHVNEVVSNFIQTKSKLSKNKPNIITDLLTKIKQEAPKKKPEIERIIEEAVKHAEETREVAKAKMEALRIAKTAGPSAEARVVVEKAKIEAAKAAEDAAAAARTAETKAKEAETKANTKKNSAAKEKTAAVANAEKAKSQKEESERAVTAAEDTAKEAAAAANAAREISERKVTEAKEAVEKAASEVEKAEKTRTKAAKIVARARTGENGIYQAERAKTAVAKAEANAEKAKTAAANAEKAKTAAEKAVAKAVAKAEKTKAAVAKAEKAKTAAEKAVAKAEKAEVEKAEAATAAEAIAAAATAAATAATAAAAAAALTVEETTRQEGGFLEMPFEYNDGKAKNAVCLKTAVNLLRQYYNNKYQQ